MAARALARSEADVAEAERLRQARREYFGERQAASQRTKDFYGHGSMQHSPSPPLPQGHYDSFPVSSSPSASPPLRAAPAPLHPNGGGGASSAPPLIVYDDAALALHLNASLSPLSPLGVGGPDGEEMWNQPHPPSAPQQEDEQVAQFHAQMAHYTRRIEMLRSQLASVAGARTAAAAAEGAAALSGTVEHFPSSGGGGAEHFDDWAGGDDDDDDDDDEDEDD